MIHNLRYELEWSAYILLSSNRLTKVDYVNQTYDNAEQRCDLYGVTDVRQLKYDAYQPKQMIM